MTQGNTASENRPPKHSLKNWVKHISEEEMPVFTHTARSIAAASRGVDTPVEELAHLILQDSSMTARVLRLANSVYYNPAGKPVNTVSRAIVFLGFDVVRSMAVTIALVEPLLTGFKQQHIITELARAIHAAVQAKSIAKLRGINSIEEVFIAALLYRLGHMAFWCFPRGLARDMDNTYRKWEHAEDAEEELLGFTLAKLTLALNQKWHLSHLLSLALDKEPSEEIVDVNQAYALVHAVEEGWGSLRTREIVTDISERIELSFEETLEMVKSNALEAARTAAEFGAEHASKMIPIPEDIELPDSISAVDTSNKPNQILQMNILRELTAMLRDKVNLNAVLGTIMEGVFRALGMERTILAFITPDGTAVQAKFVLGEDKDKLLQNFIFSLKSGADNIFREVLQNKDPLWINSHTRKHYNPYLGKEIKQKLGTLDFFIMPIWVGNKGKGLFYADCKRSGRNLREQEFQTFVHFCEHASIAFELLSKHR